MPQRARLLIGCLFRALRPHCYQRSADQKPTSRKSKVVSLAGSLRGLIESKSLNSWRIDEKYYYKVQWGHQQEFLQLFLKNHYPLLQKVVESGCMIGVKN